jgi:hypothetical protein
MSRFALQWLVPAGADRFTHVMLLDKDLPAPYASETGHGVDKFHALLNLWETLIESHGLPEAIDHVAVEYTRGTGRAPKKSTDTSRVGVSVPPKRAARS